MMNKFSKFIFVLAILGSCFLFAKSASAATYYVSQTNTNGYVIGNDSNNGTSKSTPKISVCCSASSAIGAASAGDTIYINEGTYESTSGTQILVNKALTILPEPGSAVIFADTNSTAPLSITNNSTSAVTIGAITINGTVNSNAYAINQANPTCASNSPTLTLLGTILIGGTSGVILDSARCGTINLTDVTSTVTAPVNYESSTSLGDVAAKIINISGGSFSTTGTNAGANYAIKVTRYSAAASQPVNLTVTGTTITCNAPAALGASSACSGIYMSGIPSPTITSNIINITSEGTANSSYGIQADSTSVNARGDNPSITGNTVNFNVVAGYGISAGSTSALSYVDNPIISGNTVTGIYNAAQTPHCIAVGGVTGGTVTKNIVTSCYVGIIVGMNQGATISYNKIIGSYGPGLYSKGSGATTPPKFYNNLIVIDSTIAGGAHRNFGAMSVNSQVGTNNTDAIFKNNIVYGSNDLFAYVTVPSSQNAHFDSNLYYSNVAQSATYLWQYNADTTTDLATWNGYANIGNDILSNPNFVSSSDFRLQLDSPAIDAGANLGLTTDYTGTNHIYGTPDIGAYEYQPPYTIASDLVDPTGSIRLYSDGKYRYTTATSSTQTSNFSVSPVGGWPSSDYSEYMNVTLDSWQTSGAKNKQWTATSSIATNTIYTIGNLAPSKYYQFKLDGAASTTAITGDTCTSGLCLSDSSGNLTFTYTGGYSTHTFALEQDTGAPLNVGISSISADSITQLTITSQTATDADPGLHSAPYWFNETTGHSGGSSSDWQTSTSFVDSGLSANTQYSYQVKARDNNLNESAYSDSLSKYTLADTPTNLSASSNSNSVTLSVDSLPNDTSGQSGYYFSRSGANSGWIQTNSWTDTGLSCGHEYTYSVIYRNGDGTETSSISTTKSTSGCGGGGSPAMWTLPITPSGGFKININGGASTTSNRNVILGFNAGTDIKKIAISMTGDFTDASQEDYIVSKQWDLCSKLGGAVKKPTCPDGKYTVYVKFYTAYGRTTGNAFASSTIVLKSSTTLTENLQPNQLTSLKPFTKQLRPNQTDSDIKRLQIFLNSNIDTKIANTGAGSPGKETNFFGLLTKKAVIKFQEKYAKDILAPWGFVKGTGIVGKTTLLKINELIGK